MPTAADIRTALRRRYPAPAWALLFEIGDETGAGKRRSADALAMSLWPSRGLGIEGIEIKVSRSDWLRELKAPAKAESIAHRCNAWWIATAPGVVHDDLPAGWGHMELNARGELETRIQAPMTATTDPVDRKFLAAILRGAAKVSQADLDAELDCRRRQLESEVERRLERLVDAELGRRSKASRLIDAIVREVGETNLARIADDDVARAVALVLNSGVAGSWSGLAGLRRTLTDMADKIADAERQLGLPAPDAHAPPVSRRRKRR